MIANTVLYWNFAKKIFDQQMLIIIERFKNKAYLLKKKISKEIMIIDSFLIIEKTPIYNISFMLHTSIQLPNI